MKIELTLEGVQQVAREAKLSTLEAITMMQAGAAKLGDEATLDQLCIIKENFLDLYRNC